jgi:hypothetical protein
MILGDLSVCATAGRHTVMSLFSGSLFSRCYQQFDWRRRRG